MPDLEELVLLRLAQLERCKGAPAKLVASSFHGLGIGSGHHARQADGENKAARIFWTWHSGLLRLVCGQAAHAVSAGALSIPVKPGKGK
jgi:hypothetical protein